MGRSQCISKFSGGCQGSSRCWGEGSMWCRGMVRSRFRICAAVGLGGRYRFMPRARCTDRG